MHIAKQVIDQIVNSAKKHQLIAVGEMHGVKENPEVILEVYNTIKNQFSVAIGFEYPQSLIDNPDSADQVLFEDGRYSSFHKDLLKKLKKDGVKLFGFDLNSEQIEEQKTKVIDWRDWIMANNINCQLENMNPEEKVLIVTGDMHYQTKAQTIIYPDKDGTMKPFEYLPMGAQLKVSSLLAIHLRYLSGQFYNFKLRQMPKINADKNRSFRDSDELIEIDVSESHPTK